MKAKILLFALCIFSLSVASAAVPRDWVADVSKPSVVPLSWHRGETAALRCKLVRDGRPFDPAAVSAAIYWQTNGMGDLWWSAPATIASNVLSATWTPDMDPGASPISLFIGAADASGDRIYSPAASLRILHAPGAVPNELPLPARAIDFATVSVTNAPWALASDVQRPVAPSTDPSAAGKPADAKATGDALAGKASAADATLTEQFGSWVVVASNPTTIEWGTYDGVTGWLPEENGYIIGFPKGDESSTALSWNASAPSPEAGYDITATRTRGYKLGSQTDKPIAPAGDYALKSEVDSALEGKQDVLTFDSEPTANSHNPVTSGGIKTAIDDKIGYLNNNGTSYSSPDSNGRIVLVGGKIQGFRSRDFQNPDNIQVVRDSGSGNIGKLAVVGVRAMSDGVSVWGVTLAQGDYVYRIYNIGAGLNQLISQYPAPPDRVSGATAGDFAGLDSNGNLTDSGKKASDFATEAQGAKADTAYQKPAGGIPATDLAAGVIPNLTTYIQKSQTAGLLKNDGTVDTNTYLTAHQELRYRIATRTPTVSGTTASATLDDRAINTVQVAAGVTTLNLTFPAATSGYARDFFVRVVTAGTDLATVAMAADGAAADIEIGLDDLTDWNKAGTHLVLFTEIASGKWLASKRFKEATP